MRRKVNKKYFAGFVDAHVEKSSSLFIVLFYGVKSLVILWLRILTLILYSLHVRFSEYYQLCQRKYMFSMSYNLTPLLFFLGGGLLYKLNIIDYNHCYKLRECGQCWPNGNVMFNVLCVYTQKYVRAINWLLGLRLSR